MGEGTPICSFNGKNAARNALCNNPGFEHGEVNLLLFRHM